MSTKDPHAPPSLIHLSDRRPTPQELPAFAREPAPASEAPPVDAFQALLEPLRSLEVGHARVFEELLALARPELQRFQLMPVLERCRTPGGLSELELRALEARLGTHSRRVRRTPWLATHGYPLAVRVDEGGAHRSPAEDSGVSSRHGLYLLPDGALGYVECLVLWKKRAPDTVAPALTPLRARRVTAQEAVGLFPLHRLLGGLRALLWFDRGAPLEPPEPELEARRTRFLELVERLSRATEEHARRVWRLRFDPR
ncbi:hypothetical protein [Archangium primigenium]|uniref:hypothetical protein n=1 Tax=[Archangium] primigenium TaxID=2792470 RepID=UPI001957F220|nr:hypothetical protein [Archangium primigenium]MBM7116605.1 hypothetical protein [Archangium primigenium]